MRLKRYVPAVALGLLASTSFGQDTGLPGNASSLREGHGDWQVDCMLVANPDGDKTKRCVLSQRQISQQTQQRALAIELQPEGSGVRGTLVLPFGLALQQGVTYQLDQGAVGSPQHFTTCLPAGCLVEVDFDGNVVASLKGGNVLKVNTIAAGGQPMVFSISLSGFSGAYDRVVALVE